MDTHRAFVAPGASEAHADGEALAIRGQGDAAAEVVVRGGACQGRAHL